MGFKLLDLLLPRESSFFNHMNEQAANFLTPASSFALFCPQSDRWTITRFIKMSPK